MHKRPSQPKGSLGFRFFMKTIFFIDGRNFLEKISSIFESSNQKEVDFSIYNFKGLLDKVLLGVKIDKMIFYFGKLSEHPATIDKSKELIEKQRLLKN